MTVWFWMWGGQPISDNTTKSDIERYNLKEVRLRTEQTLLDNIVWHNRMFYWMSDTSIDPPVNGLCPDIGGAAGLNCAVGTDPVYDDLAVIGTAGTLTCTNCTVSGDNPGPVFVAEYVNGNRNTTTFNPETKTAIEAPPAFDEGGNFIRLRYGPLTQIDTVTGELLGDYGSVGKRCMLDAGVRVLHVVDGVVCALASHNVQVEGHR